MTAVLAAVHVQVAITHAAATLAALANTTAASTSARRSPVSVLGATHLVPQPSDLVQARMELLAITRMGFAVVSSIEWTYHLQWAGFILPGPKINSVQKCLFVSVGSGLYTIRR